MTITPDAVFTPDLDPSPRTHEVVNQAPPRVAVNEYTSNQVLTEAVNRSAPAGRRRT